MMKDIKNEFDFDKLGVNDRSNYVRDYYEDKDGRSIYATSPDFNLRELEIEYILDHVQGNRILDLGCGNGYTLLRVAQNIEGKLFGVDFSNELIKGAESLLEKFTGQLKTKPIFFEADATIFEKPDGKNDFDTIITERFLLNLPSDQMQLDVIKNIYKLLRNGGYYIMIEGSKNGLEQLNQIRDSVGLDIIPDRDKHNLSSRKFEDKEIKDYLVQYFDLIEEKSFDLYYIISRVIYPKLIQPEKPQYQHEINKIARALNQFFNFPSKGVGHVKAYLLMKK